MPMPFSVFGFLHSYLLRLYLRCTYNVFVLHLLGRLLLTSGTSICVLQISVRMRHVMFSIIYISENEFGIKQVLSVVTIFRLVYIFRVSYLYMLYSHTYVLRHVLAVALASAP